MAALAQVAYPKYVVFMAEDAYSSLIWDDKEIILPMFFVNRDKNVPTVTVGKDTKLISIIP
ncbi:MAG: hypothetical protein SPF70_07380 [Lachnospiraceae bacterium]|nr:hypothetical protein [Lachnospiraceae bacterium]